MSKSPFTCDHKNLNTPIAGGARECHDCGHILSNYTLGQLDRAEKAEARVWELESLITSLKKGIGTGWMSLDDVREVLGK